MNPFLSRELFSSAGNLSVGFRIFYFFPRQIKYSSKLRSRQAFGFMR